MSAEAPVQTLSLDTLLRHALDGIFVIDRQRRYVLFNEGCERITGFQSDEVVGRYCQCGDVIDCHDTQGRPLWGFLCPAKSLFEATSSSARQRMQLWRKDGSTVWVETVYTPVRDRNGVVECVLGVMRDVSENKALEDDLRHEMSALRKSGEGASSVSADPSPDLDTALAKVEREFILRALQATGGQRNKAAEYMKISRSRLYRRMEALGIKPDGRA